MRRAMVPLKELQEDWDMNRLISDNNNHITAVCSCPICEQTRLIEDACRAEELFGLDELERFATEQGEANEKEN